MSSFPFIYVFFCRWEKKLEVTFFSVQNYKTCWVLCKGGWGRFLQFSYLLGRISQRGVWLDFWAMNKVLSGHIWVVAVPGRQASGLLCLWRAAQGPLGLPHFFLRTACRVMLLRSHVTWLSGAEMASLRCWQGEELVWCLYSGSQGGCLNSEQSERPPLPSWPGLPFPGVMLFTTPTQPGGRMESASPSLSSQLEISAHGFSQDVLGYPSGVSLCPPAPPSLEGLLVGQASRGPEGVVDTQCSVPHAEPRVFRPWLVSTSPITCLCGCRFQFHLFFSFFFTSHLGSVASCSEARSQL